MSGDLENELAVALAALQQAARVTCHVQGKIDADALEKKDRSPVTVADYAAQALVCRPRMPGHVGGEPARQIHLIAVTLHDIVLYGSQCFQITGFGLIRHEVTAGEGARGGGRHQRCMSHVSDLQRAITRKKQLAVTVLMVLYDRPIVPSKPRISTGIGRAVLQPEPGMTCLVTNEADPASGERKIHVYIAGATQMSLNGFQEHGRRAVSTIMCR